MPSAGKYEEWVEKMKIDRAEKGYEGNSGGLKIKKRGILEKGEEKKEQALR